MQPPLKIFVVYAREDRPVHDKLLRQLRPLADNGEVELWGDHQIQPGALWDDEIRLRLLDSELILLLVSDDFFTSDYIRRVEFRTALDLQAKGAALVLPIIVRHCGWADMPGLSRLQVLPPEGRPVLSKEWDSPDEPYLKIYEGVKGRVRELRRRKRQAMVPEAIQAPAQIRYGGKKWWLLILVLLLILVASLVLWFAFGDGYIEKTASPIVRDVFRPPAQPADSAQSVTPDTSAQKDRKNDSKKREKLIDQNNVSKRPKPFQRVNDTLTKPIYDQKDKMVEDMIRIGKDGKKIFLDSDGHWIGYWYDEAENFYQGRAYVKKDNRYFWIDKTGRCVENCTEN